MRLYCVSPRCCSACCDCTVRSLSHRLLQLLHMKVFAAGSAVVSVICFLRSFFSSHWSRLRLSLVRMHVLIAVLQLVAAAAWVSSLLDWFCLSSCHVNLQTSLNRRIGLPVCLVPVASSQYRMSFRDFSILHSSAKNATRSTSGEEHDREIPYRPSCSR